MSLVLAEPPTTYEAIEMILRRSKVDFEFSDMNNMTTVLWRNDEAGMARACFLLCSSASSLLQGSCFGIQ